MVIDLTDDRGRRYDPVPEDAREPCLVITHERGFPYGWFTYLAQQICVEISAAGVIERVAAK